MSDQPTRRGFLGLTAAGGAGLLVGGRLASGEPPSIPAVEDAHYQEIRTKFLEFGATATKAERSYGRITLMVGARYRTDADRIARVLPPPLEPDDDPVVLMTWLVMVDQAGQEKVISPGPAYNESDVFVAARYKGHRGMWNLQLNLEPDFGRTAGREFEGLRKKDGTVYVNRWGDVVRAHTTRQGRLLGGVETVITDEPAHPLDWPREVGYGWLKYRCLLSPDWRNGPLHPDLPVQLYLLGGFDEGFPTGWPEDGGEALYPRKCDLAKTTIAVDGLPYGEFPVREVLGVSFQGLSRSAGEGDAPLSPARIRVPRGDRLTAWRSTRAGRWGYLGFLLEELDPEPLQPWAFTIGAYDRPVSGGEMWVPEGWPSTPGLTLTTEELKRYRSRQSLELGPVDLVDIQYRLDRDTHAATLPEGVRPGEQPLARILALDVRRSDLSTRPFVELWLMTRCELATGPAWYALSHIVQWDGDVLYGRETFGYPSKLGEPEMAFDGVRYSILGRRLKRDFFHGVVPRSLDPATRHEEAFDVLGLQLFTTWEPPRADLIRQPWRLILDEGRSTDPAQVDLTFPRTSGPGRIGFSDPWFELTPVRITSATTGRGRMLRMPGQTLGEVPDWIARSIERFDGRSRDTANVSFINPQVTEAAIRRFGPDWTNDRLRTEP
jgi:acetoacetate decarboxylase